MEAKRLPAEDILESLENEPAIIVNALYLQEFELASPWGKELPTAQEVIERQPAPKRYRFLGYTETPLAIDLAQEWADFCASTGLRLNVKNNLPDDEITGHSFSQWLSAAGVKFIDYVEGEELPEGFEVYLDYVD